MWSGRGDLNPRPPAPKAGALPGCATPRRRRKCTAPTEGRPGCDRWSQPPGAARPPLGEQLTRGCSCQRSISSGNSARRNETNSFASTMRFVAASSDPVERDPFGEGLLPSARGRPSAACRPRTTCRRRSGSGPGRLPAHARAHHVELDQVADSSGNRSRAHLQPCRRVADRRCCRSCRRGGGRPEPLRHRMTTIWAGFVSTAGRIPAQIGRGRIPAQIGGVQPAARAARLAALASRRAARPIGSRLRWSRSPSSVPSSNRTR